MTEAFSYSQRQDRLHGPVGYSGYSSYRPWLRDEFSFRCIYCLVREEWGRLTGEFDLDHFEPQTARPDLTTIYENLVYSCHTCNLRKTATPIHDPERHLVKGCVRVYPDGRIEGLTPESQGIIDKLLLDSKKFRQWRLIWIRNVELAKAHDRQHYERLLGFPEELPDLRNQQCQNTKPEGIDHSYHAKAGRGELPTCFID